MHVRCHNLFQFTLFCFMLTSLFMDDKNLGIKEILLKEYDSAQRTANRMDKLRHKVTSYYLAFTGIFISIGATAVVSFISKTKLFSLKSATCTDTFCTYSKLVDEYNGISLTSGFKIILTLILLIFILWGIAVWFIQIKLRKVELENFRILAKIKEYFLGEKNFELWDIVELSKRTIPIDKTISSGASILSFLPLFTAAILSFITLRYILFASFLSNPLISLLLVLLPVILGILYLHKRMFCKINKEIIKDDKRRHYSLKKGPLEFKIKRKKHVG